MDQYQLLLLMSYKLCMLRAVLLVQVQQTLRMHPREEQKHIGFT